MRNPLLAALAALALGASACSDADPLMGPGTDSPLLAKGRSPKHAAVASVVVSPDGGTVGVGGTVQLTATLYDASGRQLSGRTVTWASANLAAATVSATGLVTGVAAGTVTITATSEGVTGSASVTVTTAIVSDPTPPPSDPTSVAAECAAPKGGWIFCDDFEQDRLSRYFEYDNNGGTFVRAGGVGHGGSAGMRAPFAAGEVGAGSLKLAIGRTPDAYFRAADAGTANYRDVYWRVYVRYQPGWVGGGGDKMSRSTIFASSSRNQAMAAHVWSGSGSSSSWLVIDPASGTDESGNLMTSSYNDVGNWRWLGSARSATPIFDAAHVGQWYCVETRVRLNDAGQSNGVFELWVNGTLEAQRTGLNWVGNYSAYGINAIFLENYWNNGSPQAQTRYFDRFVVSTQRIGC